ncbi:hypothetical protein [Microbispora rosea]|uniref:hypothetical protein n=1 Tax=Microbispora rosea TaxID=58117 RepID=UPI003D90E3AE
MNLGLRRLSAALSALALVCGCSNGAIENPWENDGQASSDNGGQGQASPDNGGQGQASHGSQGQASPANDGQEQASPDNGGQGQGQNTEDDDPHYGPLELPVGNGGVNPNTGIVYYYLSKKQCSEAHAKLDELQSSGPPFEITNKNDLLLLRIGIALCEGRDKDAKSAFAGAIRTDTPQFMCFLYVAEASLIRQKPKSSFAPCPPDENSGPPPDENSTPPPDENSTPLSEENSGPLPDATSDPLPDGTSSPDETVG